MSNFWVKVVEPSDLPAEQTPFWPERRTSYVQWLLGFACVALIAGGAAAALNAAAPGGSSIMFLGPFETGKLIVVLCAVAFTALGLAVLVPLTLAGARSGSPVAALLVCVLWLAAIPYAGILSLVAGVAYTSQPTTYRFDVGGDQYVLTADIGFLQSTQELYVGLFKKDGHHYTRTAARPALADAAAFGRDGFTVERRGDSAWVVYRAADGTTARVRIP